MNTFPEFFGKLGGGLHPWDWQRRLSEVDRCENRLIRIPTGFGKTLGVLAVWLWHRVHLRNGDWPRRLVWCLPTRVLVEQMTSGVRAALENLGLLWDEENSHESKVGVHLLMGGASTGQWHLYPERNAVLIGTQDMLLSRAMNRGYASPRARWPMEFGLLNQDALWIMDEVQLMDVGLATSTQIQSFRDSDQEEGKLFRPVFTWWMSATLQHQWLEKSPDTKKLADAVKQNTHHTGPLDRESSLWKITKPVEIETFSDTKELAERVALRHTELGGGKKGPTLVVLNTVDRAVDVWKKLRSHKGVKQTQGDVCLVHSRFRLHERKQWHDFLNRKACGEEANRIIVSTQVVEAGVDISAPLLVTELAPWSSLVQRFGRCARWGGEGQVVVADFGWDDDKKAAPYSGNELNVAREACKNIQDARAGCLERFEEENEELLPKLYPYDPGHLLLRHELDELFDTSPDLSGADIDISRFIRSGDERDVQLFWSTVEKGEQPPPEVKPKQDELCSVPFLKARNWLCKSSSNKLKPEIRAWVWDWLGRKWRRADRGDIYPGQTILVDASVGGYSEQQGWDPASKKAVEVVPHDDERAIPPEDQADAAEEDESLSVTDDVWQTIASHGLQVGEEVKMIATQVVPPMKGLLHLAGRWHDLGKAHEAFQSSIKNDDRPQRNDIAKAPDRAWCSRGEMYRVDNNGQRRGFRHELASTLGLFGVLQRHDRQHAALLGPWGEFFAAMERGNHLGASVQAEAATLECEDEPTAIEREILALSADEFDLLAYIVCSHHGKVRMTWHSSPADQKANSQNLQIRGVRDGDKIPSVQLFDENGKPHHLPETTLDLSASKSGLSKEMGRSWTERVINLLGRMGPFTLAWLEALLRTADQRVSSVSGNTDKLLVDQGKSLPA